MRDSRVGKRLPVFLGDLFIMVLIALGLGIASKKLPRQGMSVKKRLIVSSLRIRNIACFHVTTRMPRN
jgi:hypothetical protein